MKPALSVTRRCDKERRQFGRERTEHCDPAEIKIGNYSSLSGTIDSYGFATVNLRIRGNTQELANINGEPIDVQINDGPSRILDGLWNTNLVRHDDNTLLLNIKHPLYERLIPFENLISPEVLFRTCRYKLFDYDLNDEMKEAIFSHFTDLVDFPFSIQVKISLFGTSYTGKLQFEARAKSISELAIHGSNLPHLDEGVHLAIEYSFLGIRYLMRTKSIGFDNDFDALIVEIPGRILAVSARRYDRYECAIESHLENTGTGEASFSKMTTISAAGATFLIKSGSDLPKDGSFKVSIPSIGASIHGSGVIDRATKLVRLKFDKSEENISAVAKLLSTKLPDPLAARSESIYSKFIDLYSTVGYGPKDKNNLDAWKASSKEAWKGQDSLFPGCCTGAIENDKLVSSCGTIPISGDIVYGHSFCLEKSAASARTILPQMIHSLAWADLIPGATFYAGSYSKLSKFTSRIHTAFEFQSEPSFQSIRHVVRFFPESTFSCNERPPEGYSISELQNFSHTQSHSLSWILNRLLKPHPMLKPFHQSNGYSIFDIKENNIAAIVVDHQAPDNFTAANVFQYCWVFLLRPLDDVTNLISYLRSDNRFRSKTIQLLLDGGEDCYEPIFSGSDKVVPAFWTFTHKDDLGPLIGSMCRSIYQVLRKYGDDGSEEIARAFSI